MNNLLNKRPSYYLTLILLLSVLPLLPMAIAQASPVTQPAKNSESMATTECVILLHGLARTPRSMSLIESALTQRGYRVANVGYPSRKHNIETLAPAALNTALEQCKTNDASRVHVVTHSMGGILLRQYLSNHTIENLGRVVMIAPPNQGSEVVDTFGRLPGYGAINGPAGKQLGTGASSVPRALPAADFELGIIAGTVTINLILSQALTGPNDGKVTVEATKLDGMADHIEMPHSHPMLLRANAVIDQVIAFLDRGAFNR